MWGGGMPECVGGTVQCPPYCIETIGLLHYLPVGYTDRTGSSEGLTGRQLVGAPVGRRSPVRSGRASSTVSTVCRRGPVPRTDGFPIFGRATYLRKLLPPVAAISVARSRCPRTASSTAAARPWTRYEAPRRPSTEKESTRNRKYIFPVAILSPFTRSYTFLTTKTMPELDNLNTRKPHYSVDG